MTLIVKQDMSEQYEDKKVFSLYQVTKSIKKTLNTRYGSAFWVKAELNKLNFYQHSGHCYPDLVEKREGKAIAQMRSIIWRRDFKRINAAFKRLLGEPLKDGIKVLFYARISFDPYYGLSLQILDIDPSYTLGDLQKEKQDTIKRLKAEEIYDRNKQLELPLLPQRIAVISVQTSNGYADFLNVFDKAAQDKGYAFFDMLFPSLLQGDGAVSAMIGQLKRIKKVTDHFDLVVIVRGGGGDLGLSCYNNYELAREIALFPIPVLTGIGHSTNETVVEMVAHQNAITPTKLAEMIVEKYDFFRNQTERAEERIHDFSERILGAERERLTQLMRHFRAETREVLFKNRNKLYNNSQHLTQHARFVFREETRVLSDLSHKIKWESVGFVEKKNQQLTDYAAFIKKDVSVRLRETHSSLMQQQRQLNRNIDNYVQHQKLTLQNLQQNIRLMDPINVMKRGYSISLFEGKAITDSRAVKAGDRIKTLLYQGELTLKVEENNKENKES